MDIKEDLNTPSKDAIILRNQILSASANLQESYFVSAIAVPARNDNPRRTGIIEDGLRRSDTKLISQMPKLHKLRFLGFTHLQKIPVTICRPNEVLIRKFKRTGESVKARLRKQHHEIDVQIALFKGVHCMHALESERRVP